MLQKDIPAGTLKLLGGSLCLDFANTVDWHASDHPIETLTGYPDLLVWSAHSGAISDEVAERLAGVAEHRPQDAGQVFQRAIALRDALYDIFAAVAQGARVQGAPLSALNRELGLALPRLQIVAGDEGFIWDWTDAGDALDQMLWPVARSAAELLTAGDLSRVRQCADPDGCGWLFLDLSRNRSRQWCDMEGCGNRAKARRHYARVKLDTTMLSASVRPSATPSSDKRS